ncbi:MAG: tetratricopeptide repeat protein [Candidatus Nitrohelix vancouverensis]|uniref:Tetratricopeptide repeat protein n=1 Tax=Candidatus Nitrohelix vancouverensis TaxID=2705534 RepID=A0A7T0C223_9BACT|nr:MAG: tetratricopeptide repeat protein [Candidatus Nitrohelix vancouverensis]
MFGMLKENTVNQLKLLALAGCLGLWGCASMDTPNTSSAQIPKEEASFEDKSKARDKFKDGLQFLSLNMLKEAIGSIQDAARLDPHNSAYPLYIGAIHYSEGNLDAAESVFLEVLEMDSDNKDAYRKLGRLYLEQGRWSQAAHYLEEDLKRPGTPMPHTVYNWLALSYYNLKRFDEAERQWLLALDIAENADIRYNLGLAFKFNEKFDKALESFELAARMKPEFAPAHFESALLYLKKQNFTQARRHFESVVRLEATGERSDMSREYLNLISSQ